MKSSIALNIMFILYARDDFENGSTYSMNTMMLRLRGNDKQVIQNEPYEVYDSYQTQWTKFDSCSKKGSLSLSSELNFD